MANKDLTLKEVEEMKSNLNMKIAEAIQEFESETGMRVGYIDTVRKRDASEKGMLSEPVPYLEDRGDVVSVNVSMDMDF